TRGTNIGGGAKLILNSGHSNPTLIGDFNFLRARSFSDRTTLLYTLNSRLVIGNNKPYFYRTFLGGVQQVDYMEDNIPFNGLRRMEICSGSIGAGRLEFRVKMWEKLYVSATGDFGMYSEDNTFLTNFKTIYGFGLNGAYDSVVGPLELNFSFSGYHGNILPFLSLGYWF
ncbi:MAG: hypothetical protein LWW85_11370, partial [Marinilabiliales bacterium]|nr:hypothetical protein [Marinilabiliales bacterium]